MLRIWKDALKGKSGCTSLSTFCFSGSSRNKSNKMQTTINHRLRRMIDHNSSSFWLVKLLSTRQIWYLHSIVKVSIWLICLDIPKMFLFIYFEVEKLSFQTNLIHDRRRLTSHTGSSQKGLDGSNVHSTNLWWFDQLTRLKKLHLGIVFGIFKDQQFIIFVSILFNSKWMFNMFFF